jgi:hypothetical protein
VHAFDERVGREHLQRAAVGRGHRRIVADADEEPRRGGRHAPPDPLD